MNTGVVQDMASDHQQKVESWKKTSQTEQSEGLALSKTTYLNDLQRALSTCHEYYVPAKKTALLPGPWCNLRVAQESQVNTQNSSQPQYDSKGAVNLFFTRKCALRQSADIHTCQCQCSIF